MRWLIISAAAWYFIGMLTFYQFADFSTPAWAKWYYLWDKTKDVLLAAVIGYSINWGSSFKIIFYFCLIRLLWEVAALIISADINDSRVIDWLFLVFLTMWFYTMLNEVRKWQKPK